MVDKILVLLIVNIFLIFVIYLIEFLLLGMENVLIWINFLLIDIILLLT